MRILYGVQATGNGHITRARVLLPALQAAGIEVDLLLSGRPAEALFNMEDFGCYQVRRGFTFVTEKGRVHWLKTLGQGGIRTFWRDYRGLDLSGYDLVLNDFEPVSAWAARRQQVPSLGIAHQYAFHHRIPGTGFKPWLKPSLQLFAPVDEAIGVHWHPFGKSILPPLIGPSPYPLTEEADKILVYLPFESLEEVTYWLGAFPERQFRIYCGVSAPRQQGHLSFQPFSREGFQRDLCSCAGVISNAGFGLCSEALQAGKKLLVKPLHNQVEQCSNAAVLEQLGLASCMHELSRESIFAWLEQASPDPVCWPDVATALARWIREGRRQPVPELARTLWQQDSMRQLFPC